MKHSIVAKFIAITLCALFLLTATGSGAGILVLTELELYEKTVEEVYTDTLTVLSDAFAGQTATRYAGKTLGGCPEVILGGYGIFNEGYYAYKLYDPDGNIVEQVDFEVEADPDTESRYFKIPITGRQYMKMVSSAPAIVTRPIDSIITDVYTNIHNISQDDVVEVGSMEICYANNGHSELCHGNGSVLGTLYSHSDGSVSFCSNDSYTFISEEGPVSAIAFYGMDGQLLYKVINGGRSVGDVYIGAGGYTYFDSYPEEIRTPSQDYLHSDIPYEGVEVRKLQLTYLGFDDEIEAVTEIYDGENALGRLFNTEKGTVMFLSNDPQLLYTQSGTVSHAVFCDAYDRVLYEVYCPGGAGSVIDTGRGYVIFESWLEVYNVPNAADRSMAAEETTEEPTEYSIPEAANVIATVTEPTVAIEEAPDLFTHYYWDSELKQNVQGKFVYEDLPDGYVLELWILPGAYEMDPFYDLLQFVWPYRMELFYALGISIFLFAVLAVYLCCAAGRKPGRDEVRADGLNQIPLDLYLGVAGFAVYFLLWLCAEGGYYLFRNSPHMLVPYIFIGGYLVALIIVGFAFACAAQFKMPDFYWLKNTLTNRFFHLMFRCGSWLEKFLSRKFLPFLGRSIKLCWKTGIRVAKALWKYGCIVAIAGFRGFEKALIWLGKGLGKIAKRTHAWLHAFPSLLPVTWQWLLVGFGMLLLMLITVKANNEEILVLFCGGICVGIILYASHCFGVLWASTKEMSKGNLETKVDDKLMVGCFKDFADDLNALADVAVIAAQKQLKSERMKTELIANVSHDIKTPLTSIINYVDLLQKPHSDEEQEVYLEVLSRQSLRMKKLLEDLIDMSKANTGNMTVYTARLNAGETVSQALGEFADKLDAAQLTPVIRQPEQELYMQADGRLAWRVLSNILSNVVKYALPGTRVYVDLAENDGKVQISIKNISREELNVNADELMERFVRGDASRNTEGSGLGLNIAQSLMEVQKGKLDILVDGDLFKVTLTFPGSEE